MNFFGKNISLIREKAGLSQAEFARLLKVPQSNLNRWESGSITPSLETIIKIVKTLNISFEEILLSENERKAKSPNIALSRRFTSIEQLPHKEQDILFQIIDVFIKSKK